MTYQDIKDKVINFASLEPGWDSYDAPTPNKEVIHLAYLFVSLCENLNQPIDWIEPTSDGMILCEISKENHLEEWEFFLDGEIVLSIEYKNEIVYNKILKPDEILFYLKNNLTNQELNNLKNTKLFLDNLNGDPI